MAEHGERTACLRDLRDRLIAGVLAAVPGALLTGHPVQRLPGHASFCFREIEGESVLIELDARGICASAGSACSAGSTEPSHVLQALHIPANYIRGALRMTLGASNSRHEIDTVVEQLGRVVPELRALAS
jgi:cysteine desulfurase